MTKKLEQTYFDAGRDWYYERTEAIEISANRWFLAFLMTMALCITLMITFASLLPLKQWLPFVIHQNTTTGEVWVDRPMSVYAPSNDAEVEADIVRYLTARESYSGADINERFHLVMLLSQALVGREYDYEVSNNNKDALVNVLGISGQRTVRIEDIVFLDKAGADDVRHFHVPSENLAKVDFTTTTIDSNGNKVLAPSVATIGWTYNGRPQNEADAWDNWNGFTVTAYRVDPRNIATVTTDP